ncbi:heparinase II/III family protein [Algoriphagus winogradskyi]|uniref:Heparinase II/III-like protein n=1 Tax=Algoriphagus winogradskyi TaxID=237017 RepID=A0ABY1P6Q3_9BACT|nr:heparinase II/III family protein [Algoriphagus winogradskyi]SMP27206.1 Heparinase II/III-like protein [Algoriphagus winogradskyi]
MNHLRNYIFFLFLFIAVKAMSQNETKEYPMPSEESFFETLPDSIPGFAEIKSLYTDGSRTEAIKQLASYFKVKAAERFFFNWQNVPQRMTEYNEMYPSAAKSHLKDAQDHTSDFSASTSWRLPFVNKAGKQMDAYAIRHLFRQHKAGDLAFSFFLSDKAEYLPYFTEHVKSLGSAYQAGTIELIEDGNGAYEAFRGGNRIENWVLAHHLFLASEKYSAEDQVLAMRMFLHHAEVLYHTNQSFNYGNHQTKGMVALAVISMMYPEFDTNKKYYDFAIAILGEHLEKEVNADGFQFERSFHYHVGDIDNYFRVYKLAQITGSPIPEAWSGKLKAMFSAMLAIALPNKNAPVIQDDTDQPMATQNNLGEIMALGYALFPEPEYGFLAANHPSEEYYWLLGKADLENLQGKKSKKPTVKSTALESTGYYVFREGWKENDLYMLISTGVSKEKPDHQHGDVLGFQLFANGEMLMPNYQVRYPLPEFQFFKNSWVKNVALVDSIPQGQDWTGNQGGSGFGKFQTLPKALVSQWEPKGEIQAFRGSHDGYQTIGVNYGRTIYYFSGDFFLILDEFEGERAHEFYQNFQGNYSLEDTPMIARANLANASGLDIIQLGDQISNAKISGNKGKNRITFQSISANKHRFTTIIKPYGKYEDRTSLPKSDGTMTVGEWQINEGSSQIMEDSYVAEYIFKKDEMTFLVGMTEMTLGSQTFLSAIPADVLISTMDGKLEIKSFGEKEITLRSNGQDFTISALETLTLNPTQ